MDLEEIIISKIQSDGPLPFRDFMEMCLYYPGKGYYTSPGPKIGIHGDYYTSPNVSAAFGAMIARQLEEMWALMGKGEFHVVECGAGTGRMCNDIVDSLQESPLARSLQYHIVEKNFNSGELRHRNDITLHSSLQEIAGVQGCIISNELVDNFPVHLVVMQEDLMEVYVDYQNGFEEVLFPAGEQLKSYLSELDIVLFPGQRMEVSLDSLEWIKDVSLSMDQGYIVTIDYGFTSSDYLCNRKEGTLMCYHDHTLNGDPFLNVGTQDITAFVNFQALKHWGFKHGLKFSGLTSQSDFLLSLGYLDFVDRLVPEESIVLEALKEASRAKRLLMSMGERYKVLIQRKDLPDQRLSGLRNVEKC